MAASTPKTATATTTPPRNPAAGESLGVVPSVLSGSSLPLPFHSSEDTLSDLELTAQISEGSGTAAKALEELFKRHSGPLLRFLTHKLGKPHEAEDLLHDTFIRLAEKAGSYRGECPFRTWLFTMALNLTRSRQRRVALEEKAKAKAEDRLNSRRPQVNPPKPESNPEGNLQARELWQKVEAAIGDLAEAEKETFLLYWFGEFSYAQISSISGITVSAAKVRVHRALKTLSKKLNGMK